MLTNELQPKHKTEHYALLPYLPGHDYVLLPGVGDGQVRIAYSDVVPLSLQRYAYMANISHPEVSLDNLILFNQYLVTGFGSASEWMSRNCCV